MLSYLNQALKLGLVVQTYYPVIWKTKEDCHKLKVVWIAVISRLAWAIYSIRSCLREQPSRAGEMCQGQEYVL